MLDYFRSHLGAKLFLSYLAIIFVGLAVLTTASQFVLPSSFDRHMLRMMGPVDLAPAGQGWRMMGWPNPGNADFRAQLFVDYRAGFNDALMIAGAVALVAALVLSLYLSRSVTEPIQAMSTAAERIAAGKYQERVDVGGQDELAQLASRFNDMARKLDEVESMRRRLIADVSHELRTPLTSIQGSMEGLIDGVLPPSAETYEQIHTEAQRLNRLVDDLQELSRVEAHAFELQRRPVDVVPLMQSVIKRLGSVAASRRIRLDADSAPELPRLLGDEDRLLQVLSNLTSNALQYTAEDGAVTLSARRVADEVHISVHDTGIGIAPEQLPHVFDRFYRIDGSRSRQAGGGSGIGLTIARALVEAHGGRIWAESGGQGQGSTFTFAVPSAA
ncbi:MAG: ATP-binding protein [Chloroflexota bacterium]